MSASENDLWQVKLSEGCVVDMTLDELETAFNASRIHAGTAVLPPGDFRWTTLGEAAGLDDDAARYEEPAVPYSIAPLAMSVEPEDAIDVDLESAAGLPTKKKSAFGKVVSVAVVFALLVGAGIVGGAYAARPAEFKAKVASVRDRLSHKQADTVAAAAPPKEAAPPPPQAAPLPPAPPPPAPTVAAAAPSPDPVATAAHKSTTTSVNALPDAKAKKRSKKRR